MTYAEETEFAHRGEVVCRLEQRIEIDMQMLGSKQDIGTGAGPERTPARQIRDGAPPAEKQAAADMRDDLPF